MSTARCFNFEVPLVLETIALYESGRDSEPIFEPGPRSSERIVGDMPGAADDLIVSLDYKETWINSSVPQQNRTETPLRPI